MEVSINEVKVNSTKEISSYVKKGTKKMLGIGERGYCKMKKTRIQNAKSSPDTGKNSGMIIEAGRGSTSTDGRSKPARNDNEQTSSPERQ